MASRNRWVAGLFSLFAAAASPSFAQAPAARIPPPAIAPAGSLYARLGGTPAVTAFGNAEFLGLVEALRESMRAREVPLPARNELLERLAPMKRDVVKPWNP